MTPSATSSRCGHTDGWLSPPRPTASTFPPFSPGMRLANSSPVGIDGPAPGSPGAAVVAVEPEGVSPVVACAAGTPV